MKRKVDYDLYLQRSGKGQRREAMDFRDYRELIAKARSVRRYDHSRQISDGELRDLVELARFCPSATNQQKLKFKAVNDEEACRKVFESIVFAAALGKAGTPEPAERPSAYIVFFNDASIGPCKHEDVGICAEAILLGANVMGCSGCMLQNIRKDRLKSACGTDRDELEPVLVLALGKGIETVIIEDMEAGGSTAYYRDEEKAHHVPKRKLEDIML